jgi:glycosyltransferase involved in cell wall biosynthesis
LADHRSKLTSKINWAVLDITAKPEKIFYVWDYLEWGGAQIHWFALMREAKKHRPVLAILPKDSDPQLTDILSQNDIPYELLPRFRNIGPAFSLREKLVRHRDKIWSEYQLITRLGRHKLKDSVVHIDLAPWHSLLTLCYVCAKSGQVFITMHNRITSDSALRKFLWKAKLAIISRFSNFHILASNNDAKEYMRGLAPQKLVDDIEVTYTSVNPSEIDEVLESDFDREAVGEKFGIAPDKLTVLCVGQFVERKGRWVFLSAAKKVLESEKDIQFVWVSNSKPTAEDEKRIGEYGLGDGFKLITSDRIGNERRDLLQMFRLGDIFVLPSLLEGLPIALLEAMAMKIPAISTNINGIPEALIHEKTGLLVEAGDADGLAEAIIRLKNDADLRRELGENGRNIVLEKFDEREAAKTAWKSYSEAFRDSEQ